MKGRKAEINTEKKQTLVTTQYSKLAHWAKDFGMKRRDKFAYNNVAYILLSLLAQGQFLSAK